MQESLCKQCHTRCGQGKRRLGNWRAPGKQAPFPGTVLAQQWLCYTLQYINSDNVRGMCKRTSLCMAHQLICHALQVKLSCTRLEDAKFNAPPTPCHSALVTQPQRAEPFVPAPVGCA